MGAGGGPTVDGWQVACGLELARPRNPMFGRLQKLASKATEALQCRVHMLMKVTSSRCGVENVSHSGFA